MLEWTVANLECDYCRSGSDRWKKLAVLPPFPESDCITGRISWVFNLESFNLCQLLLAEIMALWCSFNYGII